MHIPDGYLGPQTYVVLDAAVIPIWAIAASKVRKTLSARQVPLMALGAAFAFVIMMFNVPVVGGSTGHAVGATLVAIVLGPWAACLSVSIAVVIQAVAFSDGGITALGANAFNMAVVMPFVGYYLFRFVAGDRPSGTRRLVAAGIGSYVAIVVASIVTGVEFGIQPLIAHTASGQPLYAPYPLQVAVPAMAIGHILVFGPIEAAVTVGIVAALSRSDAALVALKPASHVARWMWTGLAALVLLTPLGILAPGTAWGEWGAGELRAALGYAPAGLARLGGVYSGALAGYRTPGVTNGSASYLAAAAIGVTLALVAAWLLASVLARAGGRQRSLASATASAIGRHIAEVLENEEIACGPGLLQRIDTRAKLLSLVVFAVTATLVHSIAVLVALVGVTLVLAAAARVGAASFARKVWSTAGLLTALVAAPATLSAITPGAVLFSLGPLSVTLPGVLGAATLVLRAVASAGFALLIIWTTRWTDILDALSALKLPDVIVATLAMTQKQVVSLMRTVQQVHFARESRTLGAGSTAENREWVVGRMAFVLRKSVKTADDVYDAMLARGYAGAMRSIARRRAGTGDWLWLVGAVVACAAAVGFDRMVMPR